MHTKEEALATLEALGLNVMTIDTVRRVGWTIEPFGTGWAAFELYETCDDKRVRAPLSDRMDDPEDAATWLALYLRKAEGAP